jgi:hypothetical protein
MDLPALNETNAAPGTPLRPYDLTYSESQIQQFLARTDESLESYIYDGTLHVPPGQLMGAYGRLIHESFHYQAGVHVSSQAEITRVPVADEPLRVTGEILRLSERNGDKYVTFSVLIDTETGERLAKIEHTSIYQLRARTSAPAS